MGMDKDAERELTPAGVDALNRAVAKLGPPFAHERRQPICPQCGRALAVPPSSAVGIVQPGRAYPVACVDSCGWTGRAVFVVTQQEG